MKKAYTKPYADKIQFNYRDQVVAASAGVPAENESIMENSIGIGSPICGSGGLVDRLFDYAGLGLCD